jgi:hypothetical protein
MQLTYYDGAGAAQSRHHGGVGVGVTVLQEFGSTARRRANYVKQILDPDGDAMQWAAPKTSHELTIRLLRLSNGHVGHDQREPVQPTLVLIDAREERVDDLL